VFAFLLALTRHRQDAEDLTQETFVRAWTRIGRYDPSLPMAPWLMTIARRQSISMFRRRRRPVELSPVENPGPSEPALRLWETARIHLKPIAYTALWLHYGDGLPLKQVATVLGKREGAVKVILHRARRTLAALAGPRGATPPPLPVACLEPNLPPP
jgi:RNA polymerase sigma-70 factor (ECF subfamily)